MQKRGVSNIIQVVLIILLALAALILIWLVSRKFLLETNETSEINARFFRETFEIKQFEFNPPDLISFNVTIAKRTGKEAVEGKESTTQIKSPIIDLISVIDLSSSMKSNNKINTAKTANKDLINPILNLQIGNRIGLVGYAGNIIPNSLLDLTSDAQALNTKIDSLVTGTGTNICAGIRNATDKFLGQSPQAKIKVMIVMSDGEATRDCQGNSGNNDKAAADAINAACNAEIALSNLIIYSVGFDVTEGSNAENTLKEIAKCENGKYFKADITEIVSAYQSLVEEIESNIYKPIKIIDYFKIIFYNETDSYSEKILSIPSEVFETKKYEFNINGRITNLKKVEVYPVILGKSGNEFIGPIIGRKKF